MSAEPRCRHWQVESPEFEVSPMGYDPPEPPEYGRAWALVEADNRTEAKALALKQPDGPEGCNWREWIAGGGNPFKGLKASRPRCEHGNCWACADENDDATGNEFGCLECKAEWEATIAAEAEAS